MRRALYFILLIIGFGALSRYIALDVKNKFLMSDSSSDYGRVAHAFSGRETISFWGSSTCHLAVNPAVIDSITGKTSFNFGITGAYYNQLHHLYSFGNSRQDKIIVWLINPYEFTSKPIPYDVTNTFLPFIDDSIVGEALNDIYAQNLSSVFLFELDAQHWKFYFKSPSEIMDQKGFISRNTGFTAHLDFYKNHQTIDIDKLKDLVHRVRHLEKNNQVVLIIPPNTSWLQPSFVEETVAYLRRKGIKVLDYTANTSLKSESLFEDEIHLNSKGATIFSRFLGDTLRQLH